jgi:hypothetical protein
MQAIHDQPIHLLIVDICDLHHRASSDCLLRLLQLRVQLRILGIDMTEHRTPPRTTHRPIPSRLRAERSHGREGGGHGASGPAVGMAITFLTTTPDHLTDR